MSLINQRTGLTAAEEKEQITEKDLLEKAMNTETENAELLMLRALNKQLMVKLTDYKTLTDKLYRHIEKMQESQEQQSQETLQTLSTMAQETTKRLQEATLEHYRQLIVSCQTTDKAAQRLLEESRSRSTTLTEIKAEIKAEAELTRKTVARHTLRSAAILSVALAATAVAISALLFIIC